MMRLNNIKMITRVEKSDLLAKLKENAAKHASVVQEARNGYMKRARKELEQRLKQLQQGLIVSLSFSLTPPADHSEVYKTTIDMLEWNTQEYIDLGADEFRQLVRDEWEWTDNFLHSNARYSKQAWDWLNESTGGSLVANPDESD